MYWVAQSAGWTLLFGLFVFVNYSTQKLASTTVLIIALVMLTGFIISHIFRTIIVRTHLTDQSVKKQLLILLSLFLGGSILQAGSQLILSYLIYDGIDNSPITISLFFVAFINWALIYLLWIMLYMFYQIVQKQRSKIIQELKLEALKNEIELTNLKSQINPHFMFNSMNSIRALIDENPDTAKTAVTKLAGLLRSSLLYSKRNFISFREEMELVHDYLFLEKMRFEERLEITITIESGLEQIQFPPLMLQTVVENAIKHGISSRPDGGNVTVEAKRDQENYCIAVINDGKLINDSNSTGIGLLNTTKRLRLLYGIKADLKLFEKDNKVYTQIFIPIKKIN